MADAPLPPSVKCPICGTPVTWADSSPWKPFCSDRCRLIDLGEWINEERAIPGDEPAPTDSGMEN